MEEKWLELWKQKHRRSHSVNLTDTCVCPWVSFSQTYYSLWNRDGNDSLIGVVWWGLNKKSKALRALPVCTGPSVDIQAHTLPVCSGDMTSSTCSQWTEVTSPSLPWLEPSCSVLSEGGFFLLFPPYRFHLPSEPVFRFGTLSDSAQLISWLMHEAVRLYGPWTCYRGNPFPL